MPRSVEQYETIRQEKSQLIRETALQLFAENGYHQVSISQIAKKAGISKGLMYNYFSSKEDLLKNIMTQVVDDIFGNIDTNRDGIIQQEEFINYIRHTFDLVRKNTNFWKLFYALSTQPGVLALVEQKILEISKPIMEMVITYFNRRYSDDPAAEMAIFSALMSGAIQKYIYSNGLYPLDKVEKRIIEMYNENKS